mmetsp:Transcript_106895/g.276417  ORF Transcript_106895/g.276417 Transcript_106895/m.276417 type:complete len:276 (-) Transcript_106895:279-1106(-)
MTCQHSPEVRPQICAVAPQQTRTELKSGERTADFSTPVPRQPPCRICKRSPVLAAQIMTLLSLEAVITMLPSGEYTAEFTGPAWPTRSRKRRPEEASQIEATPSEPFIAMVHPSGETATEQAPSLRHLCKRSNTGCLPPRPPHKLQTWARPAAQATAKREPSSLRAADVNRSNSVSKLNTQAPALKSHNLIIPSPDAVTKSWPCPPKAVATNLRLWPRSERSSWPPAGSQTSTSRPEAVSKAGGRASTKDTVEPSFTPAAPNVSPAGSTLWPKSK